MSAQTILENFAAVQAQIHQSATRAGRASDAVTLIAVTKTHDADAILPLLAAGHRDFGENRVQEAQQKWPALKAQFPDLRLHLIGPLQSNKAEDALALFDYIHTVDRPSLIRALTKAQQKMQRAAACFVQVNIGAEEQKSGCAIDALGDILCKAKAAEINVTGLMCIPPLGENAAPYFALLHKLAQRYGLPRLSMGMSDDFALAVQLGATHVRVGSRIFGARI